MGKWVYCIGMHYSTIAAVALVIGGGCWAALAEEATTGPGAFKWGEVCGGLQSRIWVEGDGFLPGDAISVHYVIKNAAEQPKRIWHNGFWPSNRIDVTDAAGKPVALTALGEARRKNFGGPVEKNYSVTVKPGDVDDAFPVLNLCEYFDMKAPGTYTVQYTYKKDIGPVVSNALQVTVKEK